MILTTKKKYFERECITMVDLSALYLGIPLGSEPNKTKSLESCTKENSR